MDRMGKITRRAAYRHKKVQADRELAMERKKPAYRQRNASPVRPLPYFSAVNLETAVWIPEEVSEIQSAKRGKISW